jgi:hypothetical protein
VRKAESRVKHCISKRGNLRSRVVVLSEYGTRNVVGVVVGIGRRERSSGSFGTKEEGVGSTGRARIDRSDVYGREDRSYWCWRSDSNDSNCDAKSGSGTKIAKEMLLNKLTTDLGSHCGDGRSSGSGKNGPRQDLGNEGCQNVTRSVEFSARAGV